MRIPTPHTLTAIMVVWVCIAAGCRQGSSVPNPMGAFSTSRVPPPATGSYQIPDRYYKGQASNESLDSAASLAARGETVGSGVSSQFSPSAGSPQVRTASHTSSPTDLATYRGFDARSKETQISEVYSQSNERPTSQRPTTAPLSWRPPDDNQLR